MQPTFVIAGKLNREYIIPPLGQPLLDSAGGSLLYAAGGLAVWDANVGLLARIGEDYPRQWLNDFKKRGLDTRGIQIQPQSIDLRAFIAYSDSHEHSHSSAVSHFARRKITFPKSLLGYQPVDEAAIDPRAIDPISPTALDVPKDYREIRYVHLCPLDFTSQSQLVRLFQGGSNQTISLDPAPNYMNQTFWRDLRMVLQSVTIFLPSEEEMRLLFWGETNDLWEMARKISEFGPQVVVIKCGARGQLVLDAANHRRYEIPAYASRLADPTGAGDAFSGGFLAGYQKTNDPFLAAIYGGVSASLKIEGSGPFYPLDVMAGLADARFHSLQQMAREV